MNIEGAAAEIGWNSGCRTAYLDYLPVNSQECGHGSLESVPDAINMNFSAGAPEIHWDSGCNATFVELLGRQ
jgi:hypothetical protein